MVGKADQRVVVKRRGLPSLLHLPRYLDLLPTSFFQTSCLPLPLASYLPPSSRLPPPASRLPHDSLPRAGEVLPSLASTLLALAGRLATLVLLAAYWQGYTLIPVVITLG